MKKFYITLKRLLLMPAIFLAFGVAGQESLQIAGGDLTLNPDTLYEVSAVYTDTSGNAVEDVKIKWSTEPGYLGKVDKDGFLETNHSGEGFLIAKYKELRDSVVLIVNGPVKDDDDDDEDDDKEMEDEYPKIKIVPDHIKLEMSDSVELRAFYIDSSGVKIDTSFVWSVEPAELGTFPDPEESLFYSADTTGKGIIIAMLGELADTAKITVYESKAKKEKKEKQEQVENNRGKQLTIEPGDMVVYTGHEAIKYEAEYKTNGQKHQNADYYWSVSDTSVATITEEGWLTLTGETGMTLVHAEYSNFKASVELLVVDSTVDMEVNTISIRRVLPDGQELKAKTFKEGESFKIGGLPYPLNILNAGMLHFPFGCIDEDVEIFMFIPEEYAEVSDSSTEVTFTDDVITGVKFSVKPVGSDTIVEPYYFNESVVLSLVFKHDLLDSLGVTPEELDVFFAENTEFEETDGHVAVDTVRNKIYANIIHFSTIVVKQANAVTSVKEIEPLPDLDLSIYPNPFTSSTTIQFMIDDPSEIQIEIYNLVGQQVQILTNSHYDKGTHRITWAGDDLTGATANSGVYLCRFIKDGQVSQVKKIVLKR
ncbi:T9SS type A sorting domain-containing protein [Draconibacterium sp. IB214405]|uniref:T9SS type A sorting domain-containing protein n=1 Tax=Draconibacterium sp. IB214405 TaxID=3097352 RepID=UPI002A0F48DA|nr:T9SS type A sorting domain-containing protein [Draconibacterium sp. IB214405]MDX8341436.1 T9SS type A sorting domain-containing protein [Draconibacterium sp. IB214405]